MIERSCSKLREGLVDIDGLMWFAIWLKHVLFSFGMLNHAQPQVPNWYGIEMII
jgi:hypothetical protein